MDDLIQEVNQVFQIISSIPVTQDAIDASAIARAKLRHISSELSRMNMNTEVSDE